MCLLAPYYSLQVSLSWWVSSVLHFYYMQEIWKLHSVKLWIFTNVICIWWFLGQTCVNVRTRVKHTHEYCGEETTEFFFFFFSKYYSVLWGILFFSRSFPNCKFGDKCLYIHPNCKFDASCTRRDCPFTHASPRNMSSATSSGISYTQFNLHVLVCVRSIIINMIRQWTVNS